MPSVTVSTGADVLSSPSTVVVFVISSVVVVVVITVSEPDGGISFVESFSVISSVFDGIITVVSVTFVTVVPFTASELALRLVEFCLKFA